MKKAVFSLFLMFPVLTFCQNWQQVGSIGFSFQTRYLFVDSTLNLLYCTGGGFSYADSVPVNGCAQTDGISWDSIPIIDQQGGAMSILRYDNKLCFSTFADVITWDGTQLDTIGHCSGAVLKMYVFNNELYALGGFDTMNGIFASRIAKYDGTSWSALDTTHWIGGGMYGAAMYQGDLYVCGNMVRSDGAMDRLARWDGTQWNVVGNDALAGGLGGVNCFAVYNNDLWIGGLFHQSMGNPYNGIARWDGTQWLDPGGGVEFPGQPSKFEIYNNELWMFGSFATVAGMPSQCVARWNGTDWCSVGDTFYPGGISDAAVYNNELYICGGFRTINGDTVNFSAKWIGGNFSDSCANTTGVVESNETILPLVYPNPASEIMAFQFSTTYESRSIIVCDALGRQIWRKESSESMVEFPAADYSSGIYFYTIIDSQSRLTTGKFVIEH
jgi:hypothetical protein